MSLTDYTLKFFRSGVTIKKEISFPLRVSASTPVLYVVVFNISPTHPFLSPRFLPA